MDGWCDLCNREVEDVEEAFCFGCGVVICTYCRSKGSAVLGTRHAPEDHLMDDDEIAALYTE